MLTFMVAQGNQSFGQSKPQGGPKGPPSYDQLLSEMDANKDGKIAKSETKGPLSEDFSKFDTDSDGFITKVEFENAPKPEGGKKPAKK